MNKFILTFTLIFSLFAIDRSMAQVDFHFDVGAASVAYSELHEDSTDNVEIPTYLLNTEFGMRLALGTRLLALSADVQVLNPALTTTTQKITFLNYNARFIFKIPSQPFNVDLVAEYFSDSPSASDTTFGYDTVSAIRYLATLNAFVPKYNFSIDLIYPITSPSEDYTEYMASLKYFFELPGDVKSKDVMEQGSYFKVGYNYKKVLNNSTVTDPIVIRSRIITATFGIYF